MLLVINPFYDKTPRFIFYNNAYYLHHVVTVAARKNIPLSVVQVDTRGRSQCFGRNVQVNTLCIVSIHRAWMISVSISLMCLGRIFITYKRNSEIISSELTRMS